MARNGSGTQTTINTFVTDTTISSSAMNANFEDIASEITGSLPRDGQAGMTGQFKAASGTEAAPGIAFSSSTDMGIRRVTSTEMAIVVGGADIASITSSGIADANANVIVGLPSGVMMPYVATTAPTGWVRANGRTIGNAASSATERANADTSALYAVLWNAYSNTVCPVSTGRGASAAADYAANKTLGLPDLRGRGLFGLDDMGNSAASVLTSASITGPTTNGSAGGAETVTLTTAQLASHTHNVSITTASNGAHTHTVSNVPAAGASGTTGGGSIAQTVTNYSTSSDGAHTHSVSGATASAGSGSAHTNLPPAFLTTFIIKL